MFVNTRDNSDLLTDICWNPIGIYVACTQNASISKLFWETFACSPRGLGAILICLEPSIEPSQWESW